MADVVGAVLEEAAHAQGVADVDPGEVDAAWSGRRERQRARSWWGFG